MNDVQPQTVKHAPSAVILAAGKGTRMGSDKPKVVHEVGGRPMVCSVVEACRSAGCEKIICVVGYRQEEVREALRDWDVEYCIQDEQLGTGHAVGCARAALEAEAAEPGHPVIVLAGDGPLIRPATLRTLLERHVQRSSSATMATSVIDDPSGYGRIVRDDAGNFVGIVEQKNATPEQLKIREVNPSYYCFDTAGLFDALSRVERNEKTGEYYITDVPSIMLSERLIVEVIDAVPPDDVLSINTPEDLAVVDAVYRARSETRSASA